MNELSPIEKAYIAGFFDGDGCVTFRKTRTQRPKLIITQKDPEVLFKIQGMLGYGRAVHTKAGHWELRITAKAEVWHFAASMAKYSIVKRKLLRLAVRRCL